MFKLLSYLTISALCLTSFVGASELETPRESKYTFNVTENFSLKIENLCGEFRIMKSETPQVEIEIKLHAPDALLKSLRAEIKEEDNKIKIDMHYPVKKILNYCYPQLIKPGSTTKLKYQKAEITVSDTGSPEQEVWVDFLIKIPDGGNTSIQNHVGNILVEDIKGSMKIESSTGNSTIKEHSGDIKFKVGFGNLAVDSSRCNVSAKTGAGTISVVECDGNEASLCSGSGDLTCSKSNFSEFNLNTGSGETKIFSSSGNIEASTGCGNIDIEVPNSKKLTLQSGSGHVSIKGDCLNLQKTSIKTGCGNVSILGVKIPSWKYNLSSAAGKISLEVPEVEIETDSKGSLYAEGKKPFLGSLEISSGSGNINIKQQ